MTTDMDRIITGNILTLDDQTPRVEALGLKKGRIVAMGTRQAVQSGAHPAVRHLDLQGCTAIPGLCDTHIHPCPVGTVKMNVDLAPAVSVADILSRIASRVAETPGGQPVLAYNFTGDTIAE